MAFDSLDCDFRMGSDGDVCAPAFPTSRLPSPRWRPIAWLTATVLALAMFVLAITPGPINEQTPSIKNPLGMESAAGVLGVIGSVVVPPLLGVMIASVMSLVVRFRRSEGVERQQIKWFAYSAA